MSSDSSRDLAQDLLTQTRKASLSAPGNHPLPLSIPPHRSKARRRPTHLFSGSPSDSALALLRCPPTRHLHLRHLDPPTSICRDRTLPRKNLRPRRGRSRRKGKRRTRRRRSQRAPRARAKRQKERPPKQRPRSHILLLPRLCRGLHSE
ncbi:hypothetical protein BV20DRAFT_736124 [Pilatotrama ljubarskyi]|nr:hypothetical protein BV20DRAFT_736124 [Pilatotrama ljubarskyi]